MIDCFYLISLSFHQFRAFEMFRKKSKMHRTYWQDFEVIEPKMILMQPDGNDPCGFYVLHFMQHIAGLDSNPLDEEVILNEIITLSCIFYFYVAR